MRTGEYDDDWDRQFDSFESFVWQKSDTHETPQDVPPTQERLVGPARKCERQPRRLPTFTTLILLFLPVEFHLPAYGAFLAPVP